MSIFPVEVYMKYNTRIKASTGVSEVFSLYFKNILVVFRITGAFFGKGIGHDALAMQKMNERKKKLKQNMTSPVTDKCQYVIQFYICYVTGLVNLLACFKYLCTKPYNHAAMTAPLLMSLQQGGSVERFQVL